MTDRKKNHPGTFAAWLNPLASAVVAALLITALPQPTCADDLTSLGTMGGNYATAWGVSNDGTVVTGYANSFAFRWTEGTGMVSLGTLGGVYSSAYDINADGTVVVGEAHNGSWARAFRWTEGTGMVDLGTLGGFQSYAWGVNPDGSVIVGAAYINGSTRHAFRWVSGFGMSDLGTLGGPQSYARAVNADGSVVVGESDINVSEYHAFRWVDGVGMSDLGTLGGWGSSAWGVSDDGSVVVGGAYNISTASRAFRWTESTGMVDLGTLGGNFSYARDVSADGTVVVGEAANDGGDDRAFRWTEVAGMEDLNEVLTDAGVDLDGWVLRHARAISSYNGMDYVVGDGQHNGLNEAYLAELSPASAGVIGLDTTFALAAAQSTAAVDISRLHSRLALNALRQAWHPQTGTPPQVSPAQAGDTAMADAAAQPWRLYGQISGAYGEQDVDNTCQTADFTMGTLSAGAAYEANESWTFGGGVSAATTKADMSYSGEQKIDSTSLGLFAAYRADQKGLRGQVGLTGTYLDLDVRRGFLNGASTETATGETEGFQYGAEAQVGYALDLPWQIELAPRAGVVWIRTELDGYTEDSGNFRMSFGDQEVDSLRTKLGAAISRAFNLSTRHRLAVDAYIDWVHEFEDDARTLPAYFVAMPGLGTGLPTADPDRDFAEAGIGIGMEIGSRWSARLGVDVVLFNREFDYHGLNLAAVYTF